MPTQTISGVKVAIGTIPQGSSYSILSRVAALEGTGDESIPGEGNALKQADISSITAKVFDLGTNINNQSGTEVTPAPTVVVADNVFDTLQTTGWNEDSYGYNFRHDLNPTYSANANTWYKVEYEFTLEGGGTVQVAAYAKTGVTQS